MSTAIFHDYTPKEFRRTLTRLSNETTAEPETIIFDDLADGVLALDFALTFAGFSYEARQLNFSVIGLIAGADEPVKFFDAEIAAHVGCSDRTVRRWRAKAIKEAKAKNFAFIEITEGEYEPKRTRYLPSAYRLTRSAALYIDATVREARASADYTRDRRESIKRAAENNYDDVEGSPAFERKRKPRAQAAVVLGRDFINAGKSIVKGCYKLAELPEDEAEAFYGSEQGEQVRAEMVKMMADLARALERFSQPVDNAVINRGVCQIVRPNPPESEAREAPPPASPTGRYTPDEARRIRAERAQAAEFAKPEAREALASAPERETRVHGREERTRTQSTEEKAAAEADWQKAFGHMKRSKPVERVEIALAPAADPPPATAQSDPPERQAPAREVFTI
jgi:hypothetical protein